VVNEQGNQLEAQLPHQNLPFEWLALKPSVCEIDKLNSVFESGTGCDIS
jgi:hypothetical protein